MSNPLRQQYGVDPDTTGYTLWTPTTDINVLNGNYTENYYRNDAGTVTLNLFMIVVIGTTTPSVVFSTLPVVPDAGEIVNSAFTLLRVENNSSIAADMDLNAPVNIDEITLTSGGDQLLEGSVYVIAGTLVYTAA